jgi:hypothetical protein
MEQEIFFVRLDEKGAAHLSKFYKLAKVLFPLAVLSSAILILDDAIRFRNPIFSTEKISSPTIRAAIYVSYAYTIIFSFLFPYQVYCYYRFAVRNKKAVQEHSVERFNNSFRWLSINAVVSLVSFIINLVYVSFTTYADMILLKKI